MARINRKPTFVSLFSGCGGLDLGFIEAGFEPIAAFDNWQTAVANYSANIGSHIQSVDLSGGTIPTVDACDLVLAGSPCQGFSTAGKRLVDDSRNDLLTTGADIALKLEPRVIVMENVMGALAGAHAQHWRSVERKMKRRGYRTQTIVLAASDCGLPQMRRRALLVAWNGKEDFAWTSPPRESTNIGECFTKLRRAFNHEPFLLPAGSKSYLIARRILQGQKLCDVRAGHSSVHTWNIPEVFGTTSQSEKMLLETVLRLRRRERERSHGDADPVALASLRRTIGLNINSDVERLLSKGYLKDVGNRIDLKHGFNGKFRRAMSNGFSFTVDTRFGNPAYFLHPAEHRGFSVRETARIQGFPDSYKFSGSRSDQYKMLGNAVPPPMGKALATAVKRSILR